MLAALFLTAPLRMAKGLCADFGNVSGKPAPDSEKMET